MDKTAKCVRFLPSFGCIARLMAEMVLTLVKNARGGEGRQEVLNGPEDVWNTLG